MLRMGGPVQQPSPVATAEQQRVSIAGHLVTTVVDGIKNLVDRLLRKRADVMAFHSAPPAQGGTCAVLVLLARRH